MKDRELLVPWVERVLMEIIEEDHVHHDDDGDYPIRMENTVAYIRVDLDPVKNVRVQIFAPLLRDVAPSPELFEKLNDLNLELAYFRFRWRGGIVEANTELVGEAFRTEEVRIVLSALDAYAADMAEVLELPQATPWKVVMAERTPPASGPEDQAPGDRDLDTIGGDHAPAVHGGGPSDGPQRKRRTKAAREAVKTPDPDEHPPPGYL